MPYCEAVASTEIEKHVVAQSVTLFQIAVWHIWNSLPV